MNFDKETKVAKNLVMKSSRILLKYYNQEKGLVRHAKGANDFATEADLASEKLIVNAIKKRFPGHSIISEEMGDMNVDSDYKWIIDPLDGTQNFSSGIPFWGPMISLQYKNEIVLSVINLPVIKEFCSAQKNKGTFLNGKRIHVSKNAKNNNIYFCGTNFYKMPGFRDLFDKIMNEFYGKLYLIGSIGTAGIFTASGRMDAVIAVDFSDNHIWDTAPVYLMVKEAGGIVTDINDKPWSITSKDIIATSPKIHNKIISIINK